MVVLCFGSRKEAPNNYCAYLSLQKLLNLESRTWVSPAATWNNITTDYSNAAGVPHGLLFKTTFWVGCPSFQLRVPKSVREIHHDLSFIATSLQGHSDWRFILYLAKKSSTPLKELRTIPALNMTNPLSCTQVGIAYLALVL